MSEVTKSAYLRIFVRFFSSSLRTKFPKVAKSEYLCPVLPLSLRTKFPKVAKSAYLCPVLPPSLWTKFPKSLNLRIFVRFSRHRYGQSSPTSFPDFPPRDRHNATEFFSLASSINFPPNINEALLINSDQVIRKLLNVSPLSDFCDVICFAATLRDRFQPLLIPTQSSN